MSERGQSPAPGPSGQPRLSSPSPAVDFDHPLPAGASRADQAVFASLNIDEVLSASFLEGDAEGTRQIFWEQFQNYSLEDFNALPTKTKGALRNVLQSRGVDVQKKSGYPIGKALIEARDFQPESTAPTPSAAPMPAPPSPTAPATPRRSTTAIPLAMTPKAPRQGMKEEPDESSRGHSLHFRPSRQSRRLTTFPPGVSQPSQLPQPPYTLMRELTTEEKEHRAVFSKLLATLTRLCTDADKYSGAMDDNFDAKRDLFLSHCAMAGMTEPDDFARAFSLMLKGDAKDYYLETAHGQELSFEEKASRIRERFYTEERMHALQRKWNAMSLRTVIKGNPEKSILENFNTMLADLQKLQTSLPLYKGDAHLRAALINSTINVPACRVARVRPSPTV